MAFERCLVLKLGEKVPGPEFVEHGQRTALASRDGFGRTEACAYSVPDPDQLLQMKMAVRHYHKCNRHLLDGRRN
jgi:hypothetical protein